MRSRDARGGYGPRLQPARDGPRPGSLQAAGGAPGPRAACHIHVILCTYSHPEVDRIWAIKGIYWGSFKDPILSTPGWLYVYMYICMCVFINRNISIYMCIYIYICSCPYEVGISSGFGMIIICFGSKTILP